MGYERPTIEADRPELIGISRAESRLTEIVPTEELKGYFGKDSYLIGGAVRDAILEKPVSDLDIMTRTPLADILQNLNSSGFKKCTDQKFSEGNFSIKESVGVVNILIQGREVQAASVGDKSIESLIAEADINFNCCAFSLDSGRIVNPEAAIPIFKKELRFCDSEAALKDPLKIVSALKQISRMPDINIPDETSKIIKEAMPGVVEYFRHRQDRRNKLTALFGNINSGEIRQIFESYGAQDVLESIQVHKELKAQNYSVVSVDKLTSEQKNELRQLAILEYGRRMDYKKIFNGKIDTVVFEPAQDESIISCCFMDADRIYAVASRNPEHIVRMVSELCKNNYNIWATISIGSHGVIKLACRAGLKPVNDSGIIKKILISNYPEYAGRIETSIEGAYTVFRKVGSSDPPQILFIS